MKHFRSVRGRHFPLTEMWKYMYRVCLGVETGVCEGVVSIAVRE